MIRVLWSLLVGSADWANLKARELHSALIMILCTIMVATMVMWVLNIAGLKTLNFFFFFVGALALVVKMFQPRIIVAGAAVGTIVGGLKDNDLSQSAVVGITWLYKVTLGLLFGFWLIAGLLSTWSFQEAPMAFFPIAAMTMVIAVVVEIFKMKGGIFKWVVIVYAVLVILASAWATIPAEWKRKPEAPVERPLSMSTPSQPQSSVVVRCATHWSLSRTEWSTEVVAYTGQWIKAWKPEPGGVLEIQVRRHGKGGWMSRDEWEKSRGNGTIPLSEGFGAMRFRGDRVSFRIDGNGSNAGC